MRILGAFLAWVVIAGGVHVYLERRAPPPPPEAYVERHAEGVYALEVTPSFGVAPDAFALDLGDGDAKPALVVKLKGKDVLRETKKLEAGKPVLVAPLEGVAIGLNEFYVSANPPSETINRANAVRVRVLRDGQPLGGAERTLWSVAGTAVEGTFTLDVPEPAVHKEDDAHGH